MTNRLQLTLSSWLACAVLIGCAADPQDAADSASEFPELTALYSQESDAFIRRSVPGAQRTRAEFGVPASVTIAQAILESNWGRSSLAAKDNNYFGIKCTNANAPGTIAIGCRSYQTQECNGSGCFMVNSYFRVYASMDDSYRDHGDFLRSNSRYRAAFQYSNDPDQFIREVWRAGYATDPNYTSKVVSLMRDYNLYQYDSSGPAPSPVGADGCTAQERNNCASVATQCVDHRCSGGFGEGHGCTALEERNCASVATQCVDHRCSGGFGDGHGCTALEERNCASVGTQCVDHQCSGGFGEGHGCTALEERNCASVGTQCVDHQCSGGFGSGTGCTAKETRDCEASGQACRDHVCKAR